MTQGERIEALETENKEIRETVLGLAEKLATFADTLEAIKTAQDAGARGETVDLNQLTADVESLKTQGAELAAFRDTLAEMAGAEPVEMEVVEGFDTHGEILKLHRRIEFVANSLNIGLPS